MITMSREALASKYTALAASAEATAMLPSLSEQELTTLILTAPEHFNGVAFPYIQNEWPTALALLNDFFPPTSARKGWTELPTARLAARLASLKHSEVVLLFARIVWWLEQDQLVQSQPLSTHFKIAKEAGSLGADLSQASHYSDTVDFLSEFSVWSWDSSEARELCRRCPWLLESLFPHLGMDEFTFVMTYMADLLNKEQETSGENWVKCYQRFADQAADMPGSPVPKNLLSDYSPENIGPGLCFKLLIHYLDKTYPEFCDTGFGEHFRLRDQILNVRYYVAAFSLLVDMIESKTRPQSGEAMADLVRRHLT